MNKPKQRLSWLSLGLVASVCAAAPVARPSAAHIRALKFREGERLSLAQESLTESLRARISRGQSDLKVVAQHTDDLGHFHARFQQTHQGIPVFGRHVVAHLDALDRALNPTGAFNPELALNLKPSLEVHEVLGIVDRLVSPKPLESAGHKATYLSTPQAKLVIFELDGQGRRWQKLEDLQPGQKPSAREAVLAYHVHTALESKVSGVQHLDFLVDAHTGEVLKRWNSLQAEAAIGKGRSQFSGEVQLNTTKTPEGFQMLDTTRGRAGVFGSNAVTDMNQQWDDISMGSVYTDLDNQWGDGENYDTAKPSDGENGQTTAVDTAHGLQVSSDYYQYVHGRDGIDGQGTATVARVHFGQNYLNAFWYYPCYCITFGDGNFDPATGQGRKGYTTLDIVGHEYTHGVCDYSAALFYGGESGGLNEANSDIHGAMIEFYARNGGDKRIIGDKHESVLGAMDGGNWWVGEQRDDNAKAGRYMHKPSLDGISPDYWFYGIGDMNVHYSSGPMNRCFYFLSAGADIAGEGSTSTNTPMMGIEKVNFLPRGMKGIGNDKAAAIWYRAMTYYMTPQTTYHQARKACERAAIDLFGDQSVELRAVRNAFGGINVGNTAALPNDELPPEVSVMYQGTATGKCTFIARATDNVGVRRVGFYVDGVFAGNGSFSEGAWQLELETASMANGRHKLIALAYDGYENEGVSSVVEFATSNPLIHPLKNTGFESGMLGWNFSRNAKIVSSAEYPTNNGQYAALLGGIGFQNYDFMYSDAFTVSKNATSSKVEFWMKAETEEAPEAEAKDLLYVHLVDAGLTQIVKTLGVLSNKDVQGGYVKYAFDIKDMAGVPVRLLFEYTEDEGAKTGFLIDDATIESEEPLLDLQAPKIRGLSYKSVDGQGVFACQAMDNLGVTRVEYLVDGQLLGTVDQAPWALQISPEALPKGAHLLTAWAYDQAGNQGGISIRVKL